MKTINQHIKAILNLLEWRRVVGNEVGTFGIVNAAIGASIAGDTWDGLPGNRNQFADNALNGAATFAGCTSAFAAPVRAVRAFVWMKSYIPTAASGVSGLFFRLQVATGAGAFGAVQTSTGTSDIACYTAARATSAFYMNGVTPDNLAYAAARIVVFPGAGAFAVLDTASFDCNIDAA